MTIVDAALLGVIEGLTEFLPISSTGHLILAERLLGISITESVKTFDIAIQLGAIVAVAALYAKRALGDRNLMALALLAFFPTALLGFLLHDAVRALLGSSVVVAWSLLLGGIVLILFELAIRSHTLREPLTPQRALVIGLFQSIALIPGVSRAGATIVGGMLTGIPRAQIVEFSFILAVPTLLGATVLDVSSSAGSLTNGDLGVMAVGFIASLLTAVVTMKWLLRFIQTHTFIPFGIYRIVIGALFLFFT